MRKFCTTLIISSLSLFAYAQKETNTLAVVGSMVQANAKPVAETPEQARKQLIESLVALKKTLGIPASENDVFKGSIQEFKDFIKTTQESIDVRLQALGKDDVNDKLQMKEIHDCISSLNILKSAACLTDKSSGTYVKQNDLDGREIVAYNMIELKDNARYGFTEAYREGYARIKKDQVYGFLNYCGDETITCQYEAAQPFNNGRALVKKVNWFYVDANNKESEMLANVVDAISLKYGVSIARFVDNKYALIDNRYDVTKATISEKYDEITPMKGTELYKIRMGSRIGLMTIRGEVKLDAAYENIETTNMAHIYRIIQNGKIGFMNNDWRVQFVPTFDEVGDVDKNGIALAKENGKFRMISFKTYLKSDLYNQISTFGDNKVTVYQGDGGLYGLLGTDFKEVLTPQYFSIGALNNFGLAEACKLEKKCGFVNEKGIEVVTPIYDEVRQFNQHGLVVVSEIVKDCNKSKNCKTDIVYNRYGQVIIAKAMENEFNSMKIRYELDTILHSNKFSVVKMTIDDKPEGFHLVDAKSFRLITAVPYNAITPYDANGILRVKKADKWGMIDTLGTIILVPTYKEIKKGSEGYYAVKNEEGKYGFIDKKSKFVIPFEYDDVKFFRKGYCVVSKGKDKWGLINHFNAKTIPTYFKSVIVKESSYELMDEKGDVYIVDDKGECQIQNCAKFEEIRKKANATTTK
jgi:WG containing repeat